MRAQGESGKHTLFLTSREAMKSLIKAMKHTHPVEYIEGHLV